MKQVFHSCLFLLFLSLTSFFIRQEKEKLPEIRIETDLGTMVAVLYNDTPLHRDNFLKNIRNHVYDSLLWHRVINEFMIQGGDPESKTAASGVALGNGGLGYTVKPEFIPGHFHKKGVLAAARQGDDVNPGKESSSSQFYIVHGKVFEERVLHMMEERANNQKRNQIFNALLTQPQNAALLDTVKAALGKNDNEKIQAVYNQLSPEIEKLLLVNGKLQFTKEQIEAYTTIGGAPHLDGAYTVFGEVTEGLDVLDKIAAVPVDQNNRPLQDIRMKISIIEE